MDNRRIVYKRDDGGVSIIIPTKSIEQAIKDIPEGVEYKILTSKEIPNNRTFRDCWDIKDKKVLIDTEKAKIKTHQLRREKRNKEFEPFDNIIMKQIPGNDYTEAENKRKQIREKYNKIQNDIDKCKTETDLLKIHGDLIDENRHKNNNI